MNNSKLPSNWHKIALENQKHYKQFLEKAIMSKTLKLLPELHEEAFSKVDCLECANCCKNYSPRFKQPDIKRIAKRLKIKEGELVSRYLKLDMEGDYVVQQSPCPFLGKDNYCRIYEDRPSDCSRYPYTDEDVFLKRIGITLKNSLVCPAAFLVIEKLVELQKRS